MKLFRCTSRDSVTLLLCGGGGDPSRGQGLPVELVCEVIDLADYLYRRRSRASWRCFMTCFTTQARSYILTHNTLARCC